MITDLLTIFLLLLFFFFGMNRPFVALSGVAWVDIYKPQTTSLGFIQGKPLSLIITLFFLVVFFTQLKKNQKVSSPIFHILMILFMIWITVSTIYAQFPTFALIKYDTAIKTLLLAYFIPFVLPDRKATESFMFVSAVSFGTFIFFSGVKTLFGGGGYGVDLIGIGMWSEGSTLATQGMALIPIFWYLGNYSQLSKRTKLIKWAMRGYILCALLTLIGTQARAGLVCLAVLLFILIISSKKKVRIILTAIVLPMTLLPFAPDSYFDRMNTISSTESVSEETSAMGRVVVWRWTLDYAAANPFFGGGFYAYMANAGQLGFYSKEGEAQITTDLPKAFHSIIFEVLGEHGYAGLLIFIGLIALIFFTNLKMSKEINEDKKELALLSKTLNTSLLVYCAGGLFVGIAFFPWLYYLLGITIGLYSQTKLKNEY